MPVSLTEMNSWLLLGQTHIKSNEASKLVLLATFWSEPKAQDLIRIIDELKHSFYEIHLVKATSLHTAGKP